MMQALPPHPHLLGLVGFCRRRDKRSGAADSRFALGHELLMMLELCSGGSLASLIQRRVDAGVPFDCGEVFAACHDALEAILF